jgi:hypothetical protein
LAAAVLFAVCMQLSTEVSAVEEETRTIAEELALLRLEVQGVRETGQPNPTFAGAAMPMDAGPPAAHDPLADPLTDQLLPGSITPVPSVADSLRSLPPAPYEGGTVPAWPRTGEGTVREHVS